MAKTNPRNAQLQRRRQRVRKRVQGEAARPRLRVTRSLKHIYAQVIDDAPKSGSRTVAAASSLALKTEGGTVEGAKAVGKAIGEAARAQGVAQVRFDRGGNRYHGRVKALADAAREAGLQF